MRIFRKYGRILSYPMFRGEMMNIYKLFSLSLITLSILGFNNFCINYANAVETAVKTVSPVAVVCNPDNYLNQNITFEAEFVSYTSLGLDYKPAFRDGSKYIGILIKRDDVKTHVIPLSEMKIFITREMAEKNMDLDSGDKIRISGKVFSTALGDPWVDVKTFTVLTKKEKKEDKK